MASTARPNVSSTAPEDLVGVRCPPPPAAAAGPLASEPALLSGRLCTGLDERLASLCSPLTEEPLCAIAAAGTGGLPAPTLAEDGATTDAAGAAAGLLAPTFVAGTTDAAAAVEAAGASEVLLPPTLAAAADVAAAATAAAGATEGLLDSALRPPPLLLLGGRAPPALRPKALTLSNPSLACAFASETLEGLGDTADTVAEAAAAVAVVDVGAAAGAWAGAAAMPADAAGAAGAVGAGTGGGAAGGAAAGALEVLAAGGVLPADAVVVAIVAPPSDAFFSACSEGLGSIGAEDFLLRLLTEGKTAFESEFLDSEKGFNAIAQSHNSGRL